MKALPEALADARAGKSSSICCPAHGDRSPSLSVRPAGPDGWLRLKCFAGCDRKAILATAGLSLKDIGPDRRFRSDRPLRPAALAPDNDPGKAGKRASWPPLEAPTAADLNAIANLRGIPVSGLALAVELGILRVAANYRGHWAWVVTDEARQAAQARRLDGQPWPSSRGDFLKALSLPGTRGGWPVGLAAVRPEHRSILLCEGGPDLLAAHAFIFAENRQADAAAVAMLGAGACIAPGALPLFRGRRVRILAHADDAGAEAVRRWGTELQSIVDRLDSLTLGTLRRRDGQPVKDLNDALLVDADTFEKALCLRSLIP